MPAMPDARAIGALMMWPDVHMPMTKKAMTKLFTR
jgi:hypothetical protein